MREAIDRDSQAILKILSFTKAVGHETNRPIFARETKES
jgi:hypothetical protein